jgi:hypothetical protein
VRLIADSNGALHLLGLGQGDDGLTTLLYAAWDGARWNRPEALRLEVEGAEPGIAAALEPALRQLNIMFRGETEGGEEATQAALWHSGRLLPTADVTPAPAFVPLPTMTPTVTPLPSVTPAPTPSFGRAPPAQGGGTDLLLPLLLSGGAGVLIVGAVVGARLLLAGRR